MIVTMRKKMAATQRKKPGDFINLLLLLKCNL